MDTDNENFASESDLPMSGMVEILE